jgi:hypothetical protein
MEMEKRGGNFHVKLHPSKWDYLTLKKLKTLFLTYIKCTKGFHCDTSIHVCIWSYLLPLLLFFIPTTLFLLFLMDFITLFSYMHICSLSFKDSFRIVMRLSGRCRKVFIKYTLSTSLARGMYLLQVMNLHWHIITTRSPSRLH